MQNGFITPNGEFHTCELHYHGELAKKLGYETTVAAIGSGCVEVHILGSSSQGITVDFNVNRWADPWLSNVIDYVSNLDKKLRINIYNPMSTKALFSGTVGELLDHPEYIRESVVYTVFDSGFILPDGRFEACEFHEHNTLARALGYSFAHAGVISGLVEIQKVPDLSVLHIYVGAWKEPWKSNVIEYIAQMPKDQRITLVQEETTKCLFSGTALEFMDHPELVESSVVSSIVDRLLEDFMSCPMCYGTDKKCKLCDGTGTVKVKKSDVYNEYEPNYQGQGE